MTIQPEAGVDVVITLPAETECNRHQVLCSGLSPLSNSPTANIPARISDPVGDLVDQNAES